MRVPTHIKALAATLQKTRLLRNEIRLGELVLPMIRAEIGRIQYNDTKFELLKNSHDYIAEIGDSEVKISLQIYLNVSNHYRLFAYCRCGKASGMMFSLNFTTEKDAKGIIGLTQRIIFTEGRGPDKEKAREIRKAKTRMMADILVRSHIEVTDNFEINLGTYSSREKKFLDITPAGFLSRYLGVALLKGHIQGNKGYQFASLPRFDNSFVWQWDTTRAVRKAMTPNNRGQRGQRTIPLGLRFQVLERDGGLCRKCGRGVNDGVTLHVDHATPFSLGGLTTLDNLQIYCDECNLGKGNRFDTFDGVE